MGEQNSLLVVINVIFSLQQIQSCETNTNVFSVSLSPDKTTFVAGGEDFILYKYDYQTGAKLGKFFLYLFICLYASSNVETVH